MGRTVAIIPSRFDSNRLPGKALRPILGEPMLGRLVERLLACDALDDIVVATTTLPADDAIADLARALGVRFFRGSENDVLGRIVGAIDDAKADTVVEIMGDSPLVDAGLVSATLDVFHEQQVDFACSYTATVALPEHTDMAAFPVGIWVEAFAADAMRACERERTDAFSREHSTSSLYRRPERFSLAYLEAKGPWADCHRPELFLAVNELHQFETIRRVFEHCYPRSPNFTVSEAIAAVDATAEVATS